MYKLTITRHEPNEAPSEPVRIGPNQVTMSNALRHFEAAEKHYRRRGYEIRRSGGGRMAARRPDGGVLVIQLCTL